MNIKERLKEKSTYLGFASLISALGLLFRAKEAPQVADTVQGAGDYYAGTGDYVGAGILTLGGLAAIFVKERGPK